MRDARKERRTGNMYCVVQKPPRWWDRWGRVRKRQVNKGQDLVGTETETVCGPWMWSSPHGSRFRWSRNQDQRVGRERETEEEMNRMNHVEHRAWRANSGDRGIAKVERERERTEEKMIMHCRSALDFHCLANHVSSRTVGVGTPPILYATAMKKNRLNGAKCKEDMKEYISLSLSLSLEPGSVDFTRRSDSRSPCHWLKHARFLGKEWHQDPLMVPPTSNVQQT